MKFPRSATILRSPLDAAPFAAVLLAFLIFLLLATLMPVPGISVSLEPPTASNLPGTSRPTVSMAIDSQGRFYYKNQIVTEQTLKTALAAAAGSIPEKPTLVIHADKSVTYDQLVHVALLARDAGITNSLLATLPRLSDLPSKP